MKITYVDGDLFAGVAVAVGAGRQVIIPHVCNDIGGWGSGFVIPLGANFPASRDAYHNWFDQKHYLLEKDRDPNLWNGETEVPFELGQVQFVCPEEGIVVANMIGQHKVAHQGYKPIRYAALVNALELVKNYSQLMGKDSRPLEVHAPKFGAGLAGGKWVVIEALINEILVANGIPVYVYELTQEEMKERVVHSMLEKPEFLDELIHSLEEESIVWK